jgi:hypothetical protein
LQLTPGPGLPRVPAWAQAASHVMSVARTAWLLSGVLLLGFCSDVFANREQTHTDWTVAVADQPLGFLGYHAGTYLCYGTERLWIPLRLETLVGVLLVASLLISTIAVYLFRRIRHDNAASFQKFERKLR